MTEKPRSAVIVGILCQGTISKSRFDSVDTGKVDAWSPVPLALVPSCLVFWWIWKSSPHHSCQAHPNAHGAHAGRWWWMGSPMDASRPKGVAMRNGTNTWGFQHQLLDFDTLCKQGTPTKKAEGHIAADRDRAPKIRRRWPLPVKCCTAPLKHHIMVHAGRGKTRHESIWAPAQWERVNKHCFDLEQHIKTPIVRSLGLCCVQNNWRQRPTGSFPSEKNISMNNAWHNLEEMLDFVTSVTTAWLGLWLWVDGFDCVVSGLIRKSDIAWLMDLSNDGSFMWSHSQTLTQHGKINAHWKDVQQLDEDDCNLQKQIQMKKKRENWDSSNWRTTKVVPFCHFYLFVNDCRITVFTLFINLLQTKCFVCCHANNCSPDHTRAFISNSQSDQFIVFKAAVEKHKWLDQWTFPDVHSTTQNLASQTQHS